ncbi:hypothetical protein ASPNIDRAFT_45029 [Aspergillus niger ATCC 1015]|uniref:Ankyrin repeat protein n=1 Tax=Aspergillus niger (strain ATCC 1015 / CBS 113.46 / FGSC A1144 / LSHB Ac4 / NCTC 3858a / NRRL 328 / USDA 3528.7) TaxID=380704 RepID=G3Y486_ASPNA|nr:hypothetical protein ASPNIDRAFT_45029 [Aspergillus niger ATCC 1015]
MGKVQKKNRKSKQRSTELARVLSVSPRYSDDEEIWPADEPQNIREAFYSLCERFGRDRDFSRAPKDENDRTPLHHAALSLTPDDKFMWRWETRWEWLLKGFENHQLNAKDKDGRTPISYAAEIGNMTGVDKLLKIGAIPWDRDNNGRSPLSWAAQNGRTEVIQRLARRVRSLDDKDSKGWTPAHYFLQWLGTCPVEPYSTQPKDYSIVSLNWDGTHSAVVNFPERQRPLQKESAWKEMLFGYTSAAVLNECDDFGYTLLSRAVQLNRYVYVKLLLKVEGIIIDSADTDGKTPLWRAIEAANSEIAALLWKYDQVTLRLLATNAREPSDHLEWLITKGYSMIRVHGSNQETAIRIMFDIPKLDVMEHHLKQALDTEVARKLKAAGSPAETIEALPNDVRLSCLTQTDTRGSTPLALARQRRLLPIVQLFLRYRAEVDLFRDKADWFNLLQDRQDKRDFRYPEEAYQNVSLELVQKKSNIHLFEFYDAKDVTPKGLLAERCDTLRHLWLHNSKQNWIASLNYGLYHEDESYAYSSVHLDTELSEVTCVFSAEFPDTKEGFFKRHTPFQTEDITSYKCWSVSWTKPQYPNAEGYELPAYYSSTLSRGQMPEGDDKFLQHYIFELFQEWSRICDEIETHVIGHCHGDEINATILITDLSDDSRYLAAIQKALQDQVKEIQNVIDEYRRVDERHLSFLGNSEKDLKSFKSIINDRLDKQHERVRDLRQMYQEFARLSVEETVFMRRISLITQQSLFGMNVNALQSNPDWRWYIVFGAASLLLTYALWKVSDQNIRLSQIWSEVRARRAMKNKKKDCEG